MGIALAQASVVSVLGVAANLSAADFLVPVALIVYRRLWSRATALGYWLLALYTINCLSWLLGASYIESTNVVVVQLTKLLGCFGFALVGYALAHDPKSERALVRSLVITTLIIASLDIMSRFTGFPRSLAEGGNRAHGIFDDPNLFAAHSSSVLPIAATTALPWLSIPVIAIAAALSLSRTGVIALLASLTFTAVLVRGRSLLPIALAIVMLLVPLYDSLMNSRLTDYSSSMEQRQGIWERALETTVDRPALGVGKGVFVAATGIANIPHNTFLTISAENGLIGFAVFFVPVMIWTWRGLRRRDARPWVVMLLVCLVAGLGISLDNFRLFWLAAGVLSGKAALDVALASRPRAGPPEPDHPSGEG